MKPHLAPNDLILFYKYLDNAKVYFEYGSGGSTYQASSRENIRQLFSVESDKEWVRKLQQNIQVDDKSKITYFYNEMNTQPNTWGRPGPNSTPLQHKNYSNRIRTLTKAEQQSIDLVFIDGRFRVACCLKCFDVITPECLIAFDDFLNRPHYHLVLDYYDIVDKTTDNRMVILKKKKNVRAVPDALIQKYELNYA